MKLVLSFQYYSLFFYSLIMYFFPRIVSYSQFALVIAILASLTIVRYIMKYKKIPFLTFEVFVIWSIIVLLYFWGLSNAYVRSELQNTFFLVVLGQTFPAVLLTSLAVTKKHDKSADSINKMIVFYIVLFSFLVFSALLNPRDYVGGGGFSTDFVLNYQNGSYLCAFITNYILFLFVKNIDLSKTKRFMLGLLFFFITFAMLSMGGRGGFVSFLVINSILVIYWLHKSSLTINSMIRFIILAIVAFIGICFVVINASSISLGGNIGFNRILSLLGSGSDSGRIYIYRHAIMLFLQEPIFGHGVGSVFGLLGGHSHNLFIDSILETGIIGGSLLVCLLFNTFWKCTRIIRINENYLIGIIIFLQGFMFSMFSGYYLAHALLFSGVVYIQGKYSMFKRLRTT